MVQNQTCPTHLDAYGITDSYPGSCHSKSARTTDNIAVRAGLDLQSDRRGCASPYVAPPIVVHFNYVKLAAEHLLETAAHVFKKKLNLVKAFQR